MVIEQFWMLDFGCWILDAKIKVKIPNRMTVAFSLKPEALGSTFVTILNRARCTLLTQLSFRDNI